MLQAAFFMPKLTPFPRRRRPRSSPHHPHASRLALPPSLGHRLQLPRIDLRFARFHHHAARLECHRSHPLRLLRLQLALRRRPELADMAPLQHFLRPVSHGHL